MRNFLIAPGAAALLGMAGFSAASAQDNRLDHRPPPPPAHHETHRTIVTHDRVIRVLGAHHYRMIGEPTFMHGHYVVRTHDRRGRTVLIEIDPYTGAFIGEFRL